jgi:hypothetical protein
MKLLLAFLVATSAGLWTEVAEAKRIPLVRLTCETCDGIEIPLGLEVNDNNPRDIRAVYYVDEDKSVKTFTLARLQKMTLVYSYQGHKAAFLSMSANPQNGLATLKVRFLKNGIWGSYGEEDFDLKYNINIGQYQVINPEDRRPIQEAYIIPNKLGKNTIIGLKRIEFR